jgi:hypothetical protein
LSDNRRPLPTLREACQIWGISYSQGRALKQRGAFKTVRFGDRLERIPHQEIDRGLTEGFLPLPAAKEPSKTKGEV